MGYSKLQRGWGSFTSYKRAGHVIMDQTLSQQVQYQQEDATRFFPGAAGWASSPEGPGLGSLHGEAVCGGRAGRRPSESSGESRIFLKPGMVWAVPPSPRCSSQPWATPGSLLLMLWSFQEESLIEGPKELPRETDVDRSAIGLPLDRPPSKPCWLPENCLLSYFPLPFSRPEGSGLCDFSLTFFFFCLVPCLVGEVTAIPGVLNKCILF